MENILAKLGSKVFIITEAMDPKICPLCEGMTIIPVSYKGIEFDIKCPECVGYVELEHKYFIPLECTIFKVEASLESKLEVRFQVRSEVTGLCGRLFSFTHHEPYYKLFTNIVECQDACDYLNANKSGLCGR